VGTRLYQKLSKQLTNWGFKANCKMVDGNQVTIQFHVDDLKISHVKQLVIDDVLADLNNKFGTNKKLLSATTGEIHDYLGITIDYSNKNKVLFSMYDYLEDILAEMPEDMNGTSPTPTSDNLFEGDHNLTTLNEKVSCNFDV
jgi:hypothetical protein